MQRQTKKPLMISETDARRLAITAQHLSAPQLTPTEENLRTVLRSLRYLQLDPISAVAPSHQLVLWSRLGTGATELLDDLLWKRRALFEYWVYSAAIVLTEDYPLYGATMEAYPPFDFIGEWMDANDALRQHIMESLKEVGPLPTSAFEDRAIVAWQSSGWTAGRNVERMLQFLWLGGKVMVAGRTGRERLWTLTDAHLPADVDRTAMVKDMATATAAEHAVRALGIAREVDVKQYFFRLQTRPSVGKALAWLQSEQRVIPAQIEGDPSSQIWFVHVDALEALHTIQAGKWEGRTTLLSPFDNLISDRDRTERLWGFVFRNEMYVPKEKRQYGYYVMPILHGDQLVGRLAPRVDRRRRVLYVEGLYLEPDVHPTEDLYRAITEQIADLAAFAGAAQVEYSDTVPNAWRIQRRVVSRETVRKLDVI